METSSGRGTWRGGGFSLLEVVLGLGLLAGVLAVLAGVLGMVERLERETERESGRVGMAWKVADQLEGSGEEAVVLMERTTDGALRLREFPERWWLPAAVGEGASVWSRRREEWADGTVRWIYEEEPGSGEAEERLVVYEQLE